MPQTHQYQVIMGNVRDTTEQLNKPATDGWKPILMSSTVNSSHPTSQVQVVVLLERLMT
jgi:hypothetical protein